MTMTLDNIQEYPVTSCTVSSLQRFWEYLDKVTPKPIRQETGAEMSFMGIQIKENPLMPPGKVAFCDRHGNIIGLFDLEPEPPEMA